MAIDPAVWLIIGVIIGNFSHAPTALMLIGAWTIIRNKQLPGLLGARHPQDIVVDMSSMVWLIILRILYKVKAGSQDRGSVKVPQQQHLVRGSAQPKTAIIIENRGMQAQLAANLSSLPAQLPVGQNIYQVADEISTLSPSTDNLHPLSKFQSPLPTNTISSPQNTISSPQNTMQLKLKFPNKRQ